MGSQAYLDYLTSEYAQLLDILLTCRSCKAVQLAQPLEGCVETTLKVVGILQACLDSRLEVRHSVLQSLLMKVLACVVLSAFNSTRKRSADKVSILETQLLVLASTIFRRGMNLQTPSVACTSSQL